METTGTAIANIAINLLNEQIQNGGFGNLADRNMSNNANRANENNFKGQNLGLFNREYETEDIYGTVGQMIGYTYGGVFGGMAGKIIGTIAGNAIEDIKEEILGEDSKYLQIEREMTNIAGGILSFISGNMSLEKNAGGTIFNNQLAGLLA